MSDLVVTVSAAVAERGVFFLRAEPPEAATGLVVINVTSRTITLRWIKPFDGNSALLTYTVQYKNETGEVTHTQCDTGTSSVTRDSDTHNVTVTHSITMTQRDGDTYSVTLTHAL